MLSDALPSKEAELSLGPSGEKQVGQSVVVLLLVPPGATQH